MDIATWEELLAQVEAHGIPAIVFVIDDEEYVADDVRYDRETERIVVTLV